MVLCFNNYIGREFCNWLYNNAFFSCSLECNAAQIVIFTNTDMK